MVIFNSKLAGTLNLIFSSLTSLAALYFLYCMQYPASYDSVLDIEQLGNTMSGWGMRHKKNRLIRLLCLLIPSFPLVYFLAMAKLIGPDESLIAFLVCNVATKVFYAMILMNSHTDAIKHMYISESSANAARGTFLRYVMHEVRVPLNSVATGIGVMSSYNLSDEARDTLSLMKSATDIISDTLNNILSMQKIENGKFELKYSSFNIHEVLRVVSTSFSDGWCHKNIQVDVSVDDNIPVQMSGDSSRIEHVLLCLLNSAASLAPSSSSIKISVSRINRSDAKGVDLLFEIAYKGPGLTEAEATTLFQPYAQLSPHHLPREGSAGVGLGLFVCKKIIALHGGILHAHSDASHGNAFVFNIICSWPTESYGTTSLEAHSRVADVRLSVDKPVPRNTSQENFFIDVVPRQEYSENRKLSPSLKDILKQKSASWRIEPIEVDQFPTKHRERKKALIVDGELCCHFTLQQWV